jgi:hypothetical protein
LFPERDLGQITIGYFILCFYPGGCFITGIILQPTVRICYFSSKIIVFNGGIFLVVGYFTSMALNAESVAGLLLWHATRNSTTVSAKGYGLMSIFVMAKDKGKPEKEFHYLSGLYH